MHTKQFLMTEMKKQVKRIRKVMTLKMKVCKCFKNNKIISKIFLKYV